MFPIMTMDAPCLEYSVFYRPLACTVCIEKCVFRVSYGLVALPKLVAQSSLHAPLLQLTNQLSS